MSPLISGTSVEIQGSGKLPYVLTKDGPSYVCTCPAWRNQSAPIDRRTCKHLRNELGDAHETERIGALPAVKIAPVRAASAVADGIMLAHSYSEAVDPTGWYLSEKLDGVRAVWDGERFVTRQGNVYAAPAWFTEGFPSHALDGELFAGRGKFQQTVSIVRRLDGGEMWRNIEYVVFDAPDTPGPFEDRYAALRALPSHPHIRVLHQSVCEGREHLDVALAFVNENGGEGLMLRKPGSKHSRGRSHSLLKLKSFHDAEAVVVAHEPGKGRHKGRMGALACVLPNGTTFSVGTGFSDAERDNPPAVGSTITFAYQELTDSGTPRFPAFMRIRQD